MVISDQKDEALKGVRFLSRVVKEGLTEQVTFEPTLGVGKEGSIWTSHGRTFQAQGTAGAKWR